MTKSQLKFELNIAPETGTIWRYTYPDGVFKEGRFQLSGGSRHLTLVGQHESDADTKTVSQWQSRIETGNLTLAPAADRGQNKDATADIRDLLSGN